MRKSNFNYHKCEGERDGKMLKGWLLAHKYMILRSAREFYKDASIMVIYEQNYQDYKSAFLTAFYQARKEDLKP